MQRCYIVSRAIDGRTRLVHRVSLHAQPKCTLAGQSFGVARKLEFSGALTRKHLQPPCTVRLLHTSRLVRRTYTRASVHTAEGNSPCQLGDPWKAFSTADILAIGHDIVYRYTRCRDHVGGHVYNLPTFLLLGSRVILTLVTHSVVATASGCVPR